jgi:hypothetical protein
MEKYDGHSPRNLDPNHVHHQFAAENHRLAAAHHVEAERYLKSGDYQMAAHHAHIAHGFTLHALRHGEESSKRYADVYGPLTEKKTS